MRPLLGLKPACRLNSALTPPPRSSLPLSPKLDTPRMLSDTPVRLCEPLPAWLVQLTPVSITPDSVTLDCAAATPDSPNARAAAPSLIVVLMTGDSPQRIGATAFARSVAAPGIAFYVEYKLRLDCAQSRLSTCSNRAKQNRRVSLVSGARTLGFGGVFLKMLHQRRPDWLQGCAQSKRGLLD